MNKHVLVAYGSKYGATAEIAEKIGFVLRQAGLDTEVLSAERVKDITPYTAVVLGSAAYMGIWRKEAVKFLQTNENMLSKRQVWIFSSGPTGEGDPITLMEGWVIPKKLQPIVDRINPRDITVFHGNVNMEKLNFFEKWLLTNVDTPFGDFRDWESISLWARDIADVLLGRK